MRFLKKSTVKLGTGECPPVNEEPDNEEKWNSCIDKEYRRISHKPCILNQSYESQAVDQQQKN